MTFYAIEVAEIMLQDFWNDFKTGDAASISVYSQLELFYYLWRPYRQETKHTEKPHAGGPVSMPFFKLLSLGGWAFTCFQPPALWVFPALESATEHPDIAKWCQAISHCNFSKFSTLRIHEHNVAVVLSYYFWR